MPSWARQARRAVRASTYASTPSLPGCALVALPKVHEAAVDLDAGGNDPSGKPSPLLLLRSSLFHLRILGRLR